MSESTKDKVAALEKEVKELQADCEDWRETATGLMTALRKEEEESERLRRKLSLIELITKH